MATRLTKKQKTFIKEVIGGSTGQDAALMAYDTDDLNTARAIASENLTKPNILEAIRLGQKEEDIALMFHNLITAKRLDYFVFSKSMSDDEITAHVEAQGLQVLNIRPSDKGKLAFFTMPDTQANYRALDTFIKVQGGYAPEKRVTLNIDADSTDRTRELGNRFVGLLRRGNKPSI